MNVSLSVPTLVLLAAGCSAPSSRDALAPSSGTSPDGGEPAPRAQEVDGGAVEASPTEAIVAALRADRLEEARALLDALVLRRELDAARALLVDGRPEDALEQVDRALEIAPHDPEVLRLKAEGSLALAEKTIAAGGSGILIEGVLQDAVDAFARVTSRDPGAWVGAARASYLAGDTEAATRAALAARKALAEGTIQDEDLTDLDRVHLAEILYAGYARARSDASRAEESTNLFREARDAWGEVLARRPDDVGAWAKLSDLFEWEGQPGEARKRLEEGLARHPGDAELLQRLARVARAEGGTAQSVRTLERYVAGDPQGALGHWYLAIERFEDGLTRLEAGQDYDPRPFDVAEAEFRTCRQLEPSYEASCKGYEVMCRDARGWCAFYSDRLEDALREFQSMNELLENGVQWKLEGRLLSGVMGVAFVGDRYNQLGDNLNAALAFELAFHLEPDNGTWANNAGLFLRDAAYPMELEARRLCKAARGLVKTEETLDELRKLAGVEGAEPGSDAEAAAFRRAANERSAKARELMERSWAAYKVAAELMPDDIRIVNDAGLVQDYYLHTDLEAAKALLLRAAKLGDEQVPPLKERLDAGGLSDEERATLEDEYSQKAEAWGDAYQNLGVFAWLHEKDNEAAIRYLERAVEIGPRPRTQLTNNLIPWIQGTYTPGEDEYFDLAHWGEPCR